VVGALVLAAVLAVAAVSFASAGEAAGQTREIEDAKAQAEQVRLEIEATLQDVAEAQELYNEAAAELDAVQAEIRANERDLKKTSRALKVARARLAGRAQDSYKSGGVLFLDVLLSVRSFSELSQKGDFLARVLTEDRAALKEMRRIRDRLDSQRAALEAKRARKAEILGQMEAQQAAIDARLQEQRQMLEGLDAEVRRLVQEEQARQAREAAERRAREEAQRAAEEEAARQAEAERAAAAEEARVAVQQYSTATEEVQEEAVRAAEAEAAARQERERQEALAAEAERLAQEAEARAEKARQDEEARRRAEEELERQRQEAEEARRLAEEQARAEEEARAERERILAEAEEAERQADLQAEQQAAEEAGIPPEDLGATGDQYAGADQYAGEDQYAGGQYEDQYGGETPPEEPAVGEPAVGEPAVEEPAEEAPAEGQYEEPEAEEPESEEPAAEEPPAEEPAASEEQYQADGAGEDSGGPVAADPRLQALIDNPNIEMREGVQADIAAGAVDPVILDVIEFAAERYPIELSAITTGHPYGGEATLAALGYGSYPNAHYFGRAVDIARVDGAPVSPGNPAAQELAQAIFDEFGPQELGSPWLFGAGSFSDALHQDHIHIGWAYGADGGL